MLTYHPVTVRWLPRGRHSWTQPSTLQLASAHSTCAASCTQPWPSTLSPQPPRAASIRELRVLADKAAERGVKVCLEVVNRYETNLLNTATQAMELLSEAQHPNMFVHLDSYHMNIEEPSMEMAVRLCGDRLGYVHLGESHRGYMGSGSVDFEGLVRGLADIGYSGPITFESFSSAVVSPDLSNNLCVWRSLWSDSGDLAGHARGYIDHHWRSALITAQQARSSKALVRQQQ